VFGVWWEGHGEGLMLKSRLPLIAAELNPLVDAAVKTGAEGIASGARARVEVGAPDVHIRDAIHVEREGLMRYAVVAGDDDAWYGHLLEHGTVHSAPKPFLIPATEDGRDEAVSLVRAALGML
jgi:HK97 gp10 family phage protein